MVRLKQLCKKSLQNSHLLSPYAYICKQVVRLRAYSFDFRINKMSEALLKNENAASVEEVDKSKEDKTPYLEGSNEIEDNIQESLKSVQTAPEINYNLNKFRLHRILNNNTRNKTISLLGNFPDLSDNDKAVVIFEKQAFQESDVATSSGAQNEISEGSGNIEQLEEIRQGNESLMKPSYFCSDLKVRTEFVNDIYGSYQCTPPANLSGVKATVVYPATDKHIEKYSVCEKYLINESPELYNEITLPYIISSQFSLEWVYNILEHKQETERIIFEDPDPDNGFILLPDLKWDGSNIENLYALAITHKRDIRSLRDLNSSHLALLHNIRKRAAEAIESRYNILPSQLRMYLHYQPTFYHLHVHINPIRNDAPGIWCEKSHMLDTVINNLELLPNYYKEATLPFVLYEGHKLLEIYDAKMTIRRTHKSLAGNANNEREEQNIFDENTENAIDTT